MALPEEMNDTAKNSMFLWGQTASKPYKGQKAPRYIQLKNADMDYLRENVPQMGVLSPRNQLGGWQGSNNVVRKTKTGAFDVYGDYPEYQLVRPVDIVKGRYLNQGDIDQKRKVCVIGKRVYDLLFDKTEEVLGEYITISGVNFKVVGMFDSFKDGEDAQEELHSILYAFFYFSEGFQYGRSGRLDFMPLCGRLFCR